MKQVFPIIALLLLCVHLKAQKPAELFINWYQLDTTVVFENREFAESHTSDYLVRVVDDHLYYCKVKLFSNNQTGTIHIINIDSYECDSILLNYPSSLPNWKRDAREYSASDLFIDQDQLLISTNYKTMIFQKKNDKFEFSKQIFSPNLLTTNISQAYCYKKKIYLFTYDKTQGITRWQRWNEKDGKLQNIAQFHDKVPVLDQMTKCGVSKLSNNFVYIHPHGEKYINKYTMDGKLLDSVNIDFPAWKDFSEEFISEIYARPYGTERIGYALKHQFKQYSFTREFVPINDSLYLFSLNLGGNDFIHWFSIMRLYRQNGIWHQDFSSIDTTYDSMTYDNGLFPAISLDGASLFGSFAYKGNLLQFFYGAKLAQKWTDNESSLGIKIREYRKMENDYYTDNWPVLKLRKQQVSLPFKYHNNKNQEIELSQLPKSKVIMMVNRQPQCSGCQKHLMRLFSNIDTSEVCIVMLFENMESGLTRKQNAKALSDICPLNYTPLYTIQGVNYGTILSHNSYPAIYMYQRDFGFVGIFDTNSIFTDDITKYEYSNGFMTAFKKFTQNEKQ